MTETHGVKFNPPTGPLILDVAHAIETATRTLPEGTNGAVVLVGTNKGINAAVVHRLHDRFAVSAWVGKDWGTRVEGGAAVKVSW
jgi:hypothetical protein